MLSDLKDLSKSPRAFRAQIVWMSEVELSISRLYLMKHDLIKHSQIVFTNVVALLSKVGRDMEPPASNLRLNEIGIVALATHRAISPNLHEHKPGSGRFILIDPMTDLTVASGVIESVLEQRSTKPYMTGPQGLTVWLTGLSSAGKSTLSRAIYKRLHARNYPVELVDGDEVRRFLSRDLGFDKRDRDENIRRIGFLAEMLTRNGSIALVSVISPYRAVREEVRKRISSFLEVYVNAPLNICEGRDVKGLYRKARAGEIRSFTGIDDPYEPPLCPDVECRTDQETIAESAHKIIKAIDRQMSMLRAA